MLRFTGIDLTSSPQRPSAFAVLAEDSSIVALEFPRTDSEIISAVQRFRPCLVAIDAPVGLPAGQCCLEESCTCHPVAQAKGRLCERELAKLGIPSYFTTKRSIIKNMVYRAIALRNELEGQGFRVLEVYPYASKVRLWGRDMPRKTTPAGLKYMRDRLADLLPDIKEYQAGLGHDLCDALTAAYTAYLNYLAKAELVGSPDEGQIVIPRANLRLQV